MHAAVVERRGTQQPDLFLRSEQELDAAVRPILRQHAPRAFEHGRDGRLVVGAEDRPAGVPHDAVLDHRLDRSFRRDGVEMRAEEDWSSSAVAWLETAVEVPHRRADLRAGLVLVDLEPEVAQIADDDVRHGTLLAGWTRQRG